MRQSAKRNVLTALIYKHGHVHLCSRPALLSAVDIRYVLALTPPTSTVFAFCESRRDGQSAIANPFEVSHAKTESLMWMLAVVCPLFSVHGSCTTSRRTIATLW